MRAMIRNAVLHINNEQPLRRRPVRAARARPTSALRCTNLRTLDGKRPVFIDDIKSVFFFPYQHIRFVEIPPRSMAGTELPVPVEPVPVGRGATPAAATEPPTTTSSRSTRTSSGASARSRAAPFGRACRDASGRHSAE